MAVLGYHPLEHILTISLHTFFRAECSHEALWDLPCTPAVQVFHYLSFFTSFTTLHCCLILCRGFVNCVILCRLSVTWASLDDCVRRWMETMFSIQSSPFVTVGAWTLSTLYAPKARWCNTLYWQLTISSAVSDGKTANWKRSPRCSPQSQMSASVLNSYRNDVYRVVEPWIVGSRQLILQTSSIVEADVSYVVVSRLFAHCLQDGQSVKCGGRWLFVQ